MRGFESDFVFEDGTVTNFNPTAGFDLNFKRKNESIRKIIIGGKCFTEPGYRFLDVNDNLIMEIGDLTGGYEK